MMILVIIQTNLKVIEILYILSKKALWGKMEIKENRSTKYFLTKNTYTGEKAEC